MESSTLGESNQELRLHAVDQETVGVAAATGNVEGQVAVSAD